MLINILNVNPPFKTCWKLQTYRRFKRLRFDFLLTADVIEREQNVVVFSQFCWKLHFYFFIEIWGSKISQKINLRNCNALKKYGSSQGRLLAVVRHGGVHFGGKLWATRLAKDGRKRVLRLLSAHHLHFYGDVSRRTLSVREVQVLGIDVQQVPGKKRTIWVNTM